MMKYYKSQFEDMTGLKANTKNAWDIVEKFCPEYRHECIKDNVTTRHTAFWQGLYFKLVVSMLRKIPTPVK